MSTVKYVRLKEANPAVNPGWMTQAEWEAEVEKSPKNDPRDPRGVNRLVRITVG